MVGDKRSINHLIVIEGPSWSGCIQTLKTVECHNLINKCGFPCTITLWTLHYMTRRGSLADPPPEWRKRSDIVIISNAFALSNWADQAYRIIGNV